MGGAWAQAFRAGRLGLCLPASRRPRSVASTDNIDAENTTMIRGGVVSVVPGRPRSRANRVTRRHTRFWTANSVAAPAREQVRARIRRRRQLSLPHRECIIEDQEPEAGCCRCLTELLDSRATRVSPRTPGLDEGAKASETLTRAGVVKPRRSPRFRSGKPPPTGARCRRGVRGGDTVFPAVTLSALGDGVRTPS